MVAFVACSGPEEGGDDTSTGGSNAAGATAGASAGSSAASAGAAVSIAGAPTVGSGGGSDSGAAEGAEGGRAGAEPGGGGGLPQGGSNAGSGGGSNNVDLPAGDVEICFGSACPLGQCDNEGLFSDVPCSDVYAAPVSPSSTYCNATKSGGYCLAVRGTRLEDWAVQCTNGSAEITQCGAGCEIEQGVASCL